MSLKGNDQSSDSSPTPTPTSRSVELPYLYKSFSTPGTKPFVVPPDPDLGLYPPRADSPVNNGQMQAKEQRGAESITSPAPLPRFQRNASPSPTLSRSASSTADELAAVSPMSISLITPHEGVSDSTPIGEERLSLMFSAQIVRSIITSAPTVIGQPVRFDDTRL